MSLNEDRHHATFCVGSMQAGSPDRFYLLSWVAESVKAATIREKEEKKLTGAALMAAKRKKSLEQVHELIHYKQVEPTTSGVAKAMKITRPSAYEMLAELCEAGRLRSERIGTADRTMRYVSRVMP